MNRPRAHRGREQQPEPEATAPEKTEAPIPPSAGPVEPIAEQPEPAGDPAPEQPPQQDPPAEPETGEEREEEEEDDTPSDVPPKPTGPLADLQTKLRDLLDYDQIAEVRLALSSRSAELEKHIKKANDLGVREEDARRRVRLIDGSDTRFGLMRIFAPEEATYQRDIFFDPEKPNGRPDGHVDDFEVDAEAELLAAETGTVVDGAAEVAPGTVEIGDPAEGWDQGAPAVSADAAERLAQTAEVSA